METVKGRGDDSAPQDAVSARSRAASRITVSVLIPTYNRAHVVAEAIDSVLEQDPPPDQVIVIDDGSTDDTASVLARYGDRIEVVCQANAGVAAARNAGLGRARCSWIAFLDSDDLWLPGRMALLHRDLAGAEPEVEVHLADLFFGDGDDAPRLLTLRAVDAPEGGAVLLEDPLTYAVSGASTVCAAVRRDALAAIGGFPEEMTIYEDTASFARLALRGRWLVTSDLAARARRLDGDEAALTHQERTGRIRTLRVQDGILAEVLSADLPPERRRPIAAKASGVAYRLALARMVTEPAAGRSDLWRAARLHPSPAKGWIRSGLTRILGARLGERLFARRPTFSRS